MISTIQSIQFLRQVGGTFNRPIESICRDDSGLEVYYLKYFRTGNEIEGLVAEVVCHFLARKMNLLTPDISYVEIGDHPIPDEFVHPEHLSTGKVVFGSKKAEKVDELTKLEFIFSKHEFNRLEYPIHLLRVGLFDLWIGNNDRTEDNYNLFLTRGKKQKIVVFDHFEAFNKITESSFRDVNTFIEIYEKGFLGSKYAYEMLGWVSKDDLNREVDEFVRNIQGLDIPEEIGKIEETFPDSWDIGAEVTDYIVRYLSSEDRLNNVLEEVNNYIKYLPEK
ncbi:MAG: HipA family kinase [Balneolaceae bacterium]|nr:HipA family kinase [Balneolaceae bacterium]